MIDCSSSFRVTALYRFTRFADPEGLRKPLEDLCRTNGVLGTLLLAHEGVNGTISGTSQAIDRVLAHLRSLPGCGDLRTNDTAAAAIPFRRLKVRVKREIVSMGAPELDPAANAGTYVAPEAWNDLIAQPDTIVIDTRNDYEVTIGSFPGAINPHTRHFGEFPTWFHEHRERILAGGPKLKVAMFCTGGIRCEKATALLRTEGVEEVYHLEGGILNYLEKVPVEHSRWAGECFVFDDRGAVSHGRQERDHEGWLDAAGMDADAMANT